MVEKNLEQSYTESVRLANKHKVAVTLHYKGLDYTVKPMRLGAKITKLKEENTKLKAEVERLRRRFRLIINFTEADKRSDDIGERYIKDIRYFKWVAKNALKENNNAK